MTRRTFLLLYGVLLLTGLPLPIWLLFQGQTWVGRGLGILGVALLLTPILLARVWRSPQPGRWRGVLLLIGLGGAGFLQALVLTAPSGVAPAGSPIQQYHSQGGQFQRYSPFNLIPESEQVNLGFLLMTFLDPYLTAEQTARVAPITLAHYEAMAADENFQELGSSMGLAYAGLFGLPVPQDHYFLYTPANAGDEPRPAIIFLHGSAGNFKSYSWVWATLAEQEGYIIIAPSYGFGNWDGAGAAAVAQALADAQTHANIDPTRIYLMGLSNGGRGVSRLAASQPEQYRGLIFLSPVFDGAFLDSPAFAAAWANRPVLILSGAADRRIPASYVLERADHLDAAGLNVSTTVYPQEDHFLVFSQPEAIIAAIAAWLATTNP
ncbi:MAG: prolyl oligopeptidase family serine peptidase [Anaerolineales bacterium]|nr:prolyl oligopeptidase family serine peptidase [Anaerolineales bacterium]